MGKRRRDHVAQRRSGPTPQKLTVLADRLAADDMAKVVSDTLQGIRLRHDHPGPPIPTGWPGTVSSSWDRRSGASKHATRASAKPCRSAVMITDHVPAVRVPPDHAGDRVAAAVPA